MKRFTIVALLLLALPAHAQEKAPPQSRADITLSFAPVVKKASPAVVNIYTRTKVQVQERLSPFANDPFFKQFFGQQFEFGGRTREQVISSLGSGVIVRADGTIVTSHHVIKDAQTITVVLADKREFEAKVLMKDPQFDLAFLKIDAPQPLPYLELRNSDTLEVGDLVLAIGNPFGVGQTVTSGIISGLARAARGVSDYQFFIQTDAAINPGNSGGALVDMDAHLIGINTAIYSQSGGSVGIGFAIPSNIVKAMLDSKIEGGHIVRPWLGFGVQPVTAEVADSLGLKPARGVLVNKVAPDSPAAKAGLKTGDVLLSVNGTDVSSAQDVGYRLALAKIGDTAKLRIWRGGNEQPVDVALIAAPSMPPDQRTLKGKHPLDGVTVANLSPALAMDIGMEAESGVVVLDAGAGGLGISALQPGDIILEINGVKITSVAQLDSVLKASKHKWKIVGKRGDNTITMNVEI